MPVIDFVTAYGRLRDFWHYYAGLSRPDISDDFRRAVDRVRKSVLSHFRKFGGEAEKLTRSTSGPTMTEQAYRSLQATASQADSDGDLMRAGGIREVLEAIDKRADGELRTLTTKHGLAAVPATRAPRRAQATITPAETVAAIPTPASVLGEIDWCIAHKQLHGLHHYFSGIGQLAAAEDFFQAARRMQDFVRRRFSDLGGKSDDLPPVRRGSRPEQMYRALQDMLRSAEQPSDAVRARKILQALESINRSASKELEVLTRQHGSLDELAGKANLPRQRPPVLVGPAQTGSAAPVAVPPPLQPVQPVTARETVPFDPGVRPAGEAVPPHSVSATPTSTAAAAPAPLLTPPWLKDDFAVERALIAGDLPPGFDASRLIVEAGQFEEFGLEAELAAGRFPMETIDILIDGFQITDETGGNALFIEYLTSLKENIERALLDAYPERVDPEWLDDVRQLLRGRGESAASGAVARSPVADPFSEPPGPSSRVMPARTPRPPVESPGAHPGQQGAETPGFGGRTAQPPVSQREAIVEQFKSEDALLEAELALQTGGGGALGWSATYLRGVLDDIRRLNDTARTDFAAAVALPDIDWSGIESLLTVFDVTPPSV